MQFAIFGSARAGSERPGAALGEAFHDFVEFNVEAEALGYCATFLVEHHFTGWNQISATLQVLTRLAACTTTLRLGDAAQGCHPFSPQPFSSAVHESGGAS
jgi:alkanesulfonate monooxygenase SsuD/methylene tetrahydromethanopterin reductase-like flavin-dependent oxidoreductase (luciferase family)